MRKTKNTKKRLKIVFGDTKSGHFVSQITNEQIKLRDSVTYFSEIGLQYWK